MKIGKILGLTALVSTIALGNGLVNKVKDSGIKAIPSSNYELLKIIDDPKDPITDAKVELGKKNFILTHDFQEVI